MMEKHANRNEKNFQREQESKQISDESLRLNPGIVVICQSDSWCYPMRGNVRSVFDLIVNIHYVPVYRKWVNQSQKIKTGRRNWCLMKRRESKSVWPSISIIPTHKSLHFQGVLVRLS